MSVENDLISEMCRRLTKDIDDMILNTIVETEKDIKREIIRKKIANELRRNRE